MSFVTITKGKKKVPSTSELSSALTALGATVNQTGQPDNETVTADFTDGAVDVTETALRTQLNSSAKTNWWGIKLT